MFTDSDSDSSSDSDSPSALLKWWLLLSKKGHRRWNVHPVNKERIERGEFYHLYRQLKNYPDRYFDYLRMTQSTFRYILELIEPKIVKVYTNVHKQPISAEERLVITLR